MQETPAPIDHCGYPRRPRRENQSVTQARAAPDGNTIPGRPSFRQAERAALNRRTGRSIPGVTIRSPFPGDPRDFVPDFAFVVSRTVAMVSILCVLAALRETYSSTSFVIGLIPSVISRERKGVPPSNVGQAVPDGNGLRTETAGCGPLVCVRDCRPSSGRRRAELGQNRAAPAIPRDFVSATIPLASPKLGLAKRQRGRDAEPETAW
jgi:hypothetical protein